MPAPAPPAPRSSPSAPADDGPAVTARGAGADDVPALALMLRACALHYEGAAAPPPERAAAAAREAIEGREGTRFALAFLGGAPAGLACYALLRPGEGLGPLLFLKQLFVLPERRGRRVGAALLAHLAREALALGCARIDLTTGLDAPGARRFYAAHGGAELPLKVFVRFEGAALARLAAGDGTAAAGAPA